MQKGVPVELLFSLAPNLGNAPTEEAQVGIDPKAPTYCILQSLSSTVFANQLQRCIKLPEGVRGRFRPHAYVDAQGNIMFEAAFAYERSEQATEFIESLPTLLPKYWDHRAVDELSQRAKAICKPWKIDLPLKSHAQQAA
jgi:hypothetical protein